MLDRGRKRNAWLVYQVSSAEKKKKTFQHDNTYLIGRKKYWLFFHLGVWRTELRFYWILSCHRMIRECLVCAPMFFMIGDSPNIRQTFDNRAINRVRYVINDSHHQSNVDEEEKRNILSARISVCYQSIISSAWSRWSLTRWSCAVQLVFEREWWSMEQLPWMIYPRKDSHKRIRAAWRLLCSMKMKRFVHDDTHLDIHAVLFFSGRFNA